jgi:hypothetical protein
MITTPDTLLQCRFEDSTNDGSPAKLIMPIGTNIYEAGNKFSKNYYNNNTTQLSVNHSDRFNIIGSFSVLVWIRREISADTVSHGVMAKNYGAEGNRTWRMQISSVGSGIMDFSITENGTDMIVAQGGGTLAYGVWSHYAGVFKSGEYVRLYRNGIQVANTNTTAVNSFHRTGPLYLGNSLSTNTNRRWTGGFKNFVIVNRAATQNDIKRHMLNMHIF